jgi:hypothetical protein
MEWYLVKHRDMFTFLITEEVNILNNSVTVSQSFLTQVRTTLIVYGTRVSELGSKQHRCGKGNTHYTMVK